jgi:hypothetical protein
MNKKSQFFLNYITVQKKGTILRLSQVSTFYINLQQRNPFLKKVNLDFNIYTEDIEPDKMYF